MKLCNRQHDRFRLRGHVIKVDLLPVKWQSARHLDMARLVPREEMGHIFICFWNFKKAAWKLLLYVMPSPERGGRHPQFPPGFAPTSQPTLPVSSCLWLDYFSYNGHGFKTHCGFNNLKWLLQQGWSTAHMSKIDWDNDPQILLLLVSVLDFTFMKTEVCNAQQSCYCTL